MESEFEFLGVVAGIYPHQIERQRETTVNKEFAKETFLILNFLYLVRNNGHRGLRWAVDLGGL